MNGLVKKSRVQSVQQLTTTIIQRYTLNPVLSQQSYLVEDVNLHSLTFIHNLIRTLSMNERVQMMRSRQVHTSLILTV